MRAKVQIPSYYLYQLDKDNTEILRKFAELATLRELVRQKEAALRAERAYRERSTTMLPIKAGDHSRRHYRTAG
ncbi:hypothetical protein V1272_002027 [Bradyrhizobium sp. AZCC 1708]